MVAVFYNCQVSPDPWIWTYSKYCLLSNKISKTHGGFNLAFWTVSHSYHCYSRLRRHNSCGWSCWVTGWWRSCHKSWRWCIALCWRISSSRWSSSRIGRFGCLGCTVGRRWFTKTLIHGWLSHSETSTKQV